ncbi:hypothetical protein ACFY5D_21685 [Paeniglutamicibacter sp. NPDC012692]|uniref:hypothetical protein n=1 Tax=Paeniglutamicibacter sp. NPDC012692 TaxID=3364388 RepID=UPI0036877F12
MHWRGFLAAIPLLLGRAVDDLPTLAVYEGQLYLDAYTASIAKFSAWFRASGCHFL